MGKGGRGNSRVTRGSLEGPMPLDFYHFSFISFLNDNDDLFILCGFLFTKQKYIVLILKKN